MNKLLIGFVFAAVLVAAGCITQFEEESCTDKLMGKTMTLSEAKQMALASECGDRLKSTSICNENTGTWWIDLDIETDICNPACVVYIAAERAVINWRCTGAIP